MQIDIIGCGIGGLSLGYYLKSNKNIDGLRIWDKSNVPGGLASTFKFDNYELEKFYHHIFDMVKFYYRCILFRKTI